MRKLIFTIFMLPHISNADVIETWQCTKNYKRDILVIAYVNKDRESGKIKVAGVIHKATFSVKGFERRWDFGLTKKFKYDYSFIIEPDGSASYYDFSSSKPGKIVQPSIHMNCKMK